MLKGKNQDNEGSNNNSDINLVCEDYESLEVLTINFIRLDNKWVLDLGHTFHISLNEYWFTNLEECSLGKFLVKNDYECQVKRIG